MNGVALKSSKQLPGLDNDWPPPLGPAPVCWKIRTKGLNIALMHFAGYNNNHIKFKVSHLMRAVMFFTVKHQTSFFNYVSIIWARNFVVNAQDLLLWATVSFKLNIFLLLLLSWEKKIVNRFTKSYAHPLLCLHLCYPFTVLY